MNPAPPVIRILLPLRATRRVYPRILPVMLRVALLVTIAAVAATAAGAAPGTASSGTIDLRITFRADASAPPPARKKKSGSGTRLFVGLLVVLALVAAGIVGYQALESSSSKSVQLREDVRGNVDNAVEELRGLIEDNTQ